MTAAERWVRERLPDAPPRLVETMLAALPAEAPSVAVALAEGALRLYEAVVRGGGGREDALPLLSADALLTHAFQAQAESDPAGVAELAARWGGDGRLGALAASLAASTPHPRPT
jgi:hypothetical protein